MTILGSGLLSSSYVQPVLSATVYEDINFQGNSKELLPGNYDLEQMGVANDSISSLKVSPGLKITLYEHIGYGGGSKTFTSDAAYVGDDFNNRASSIKVEFV